MKQVRDAKGNVYDCKPLTMSQLVAIEDMIGGPLGTHAQHMTFRHAAYALSCALDLSEAEVLARFDAVTLGPALKTVFSCVDTLNTKPRTRGSQDDL